MSQSLFLLAVFAVTQGVHAQDTVKLRVLDAQGGPTQHCAVTLLRAFEVPGRYGVVPEHRERKLTPQDFQGDFCTIAGVAAGRYVLLAKADLHAPTLSEPFGVGASEPPEVVVKLSRGVTREGLVTDAKGKPVAGAEVRTCGRNALGEDSPMAALFGQFIAEVVTTTATKTDKDGRYKLERLAVGEYRIVVSHQDHCSGQFEPAVADDKNGEWPTLVLEPGTLVSGTVTVGGEAKAGVTVTINAPIEVGVDKNPAKARVFQAVTDETGRYAFAMRIPAGDWRIHALPPQPEGANPFERLVAIKQSDRALKVETVDGKRTEDFALPAK
ncbi:MAG: carboxypeptidase regulatory-like domain-containing protein [Planctomycetes bacterium]|nr:carboxypeptidase regulatory-like domain-containing protein [Planctomycetota bacterium]